MSYSHKNGIFNDRLKWKIRYKWYRVKNTPRSIVLCVRFPFLYPRNRFTGLKYNNWRIIEKMKRLYSEAVEFGDKENGFKTIVKNRFKFFRWHLLKFYHDKFLQVLFCIPTHNELDAMDEGWRKTFGVQMCKEIKRALKKAGGRKAVRKYRIEQIKEKYGGLCWYDGGAPNEVHKIIQKYEYISFRTCIDCGRPADGYSEGWIEPYCEECSKKYNIASFRKFGTKEDPWYGYYAL